MLVPGEVVCPRSLFFEGLVFPCRSPDRGDLLRGGPLVVGRNVDLGVLVGRGWYHGLLGLGSGGEQRTDSIIKSHIDNV